MLYELLVLLCCLLILIGLLSTSITVHDKMNSLWWAVIGIAIIIATVPALYILYGFVNMYYFWMMLVLTIVSFISINKLTK